MTLDNQTSIKTTKMTRLETDGTTSTSRSSINDNPNQNDDIYNAVTDHCINSCRRTNDEATTIPQTTGSDRDDSSSRLKLLYLLDTYQQCHTLGNQQHQSYHWNKTKYILNHQNSSTLMNINHDEMYCTPLLSIRKQLTMINDENDDDEKINGANEGKSNKSSRNNTISSSRFMIQTINVSSQLSTQQQQPRTKMMSVAIKHRFISDID
jgi:hypothetical protein